jgi:hypothetical protein
MAKAAATNKTAPPLRDTFADVSFLAANVEVAWNANLLGRFLMINRATLTNRMIW